MLKTNWPISQLITVYGNRTTFGDKLNNYVYFLNYTLKWLFLKKTDPVWFNIIHFSKIQVPEGIQIGRSNFLAWETALHLTINSHEIHVVRKKSKTKLLVSKWFSLSIWATSHLRHGHQLLQGRKTSDIKHFSAKKIETAKVCIVYIYVFT